MSAERAARNVTVADTGVKADLIERPIAPATPTVVSEGAALISMIERAARDPNVDIDKFERLLAVQRTIKAEEAEKAFNTAMKDAQGEMRPVGADASNPQTRSRYASYAALDRAIRPIYTKHGFALSFDEDESPKPDHIRVVCYVSHEGGHKRTYRKDMPADGKGAKGGDVMTKTHATGAAASYGARYLLKGIFNIAVGEDDRDGNAPAPDRPLISEDQAIALRDLMREVKANEERFLRHIQVGSIEAIFADKFDAAVAILETKRAAR